jgi:hypothetical protein
MGRYNLTRRIQIGEMLAAGETVTAIARALGVSTPTVCYYARTLGVSPSEKFNRRYDWAEVQRYYDAGHSVTECQERFGFSRATFSNAVSRGAITPRPQRTPLCDILVAGRKRNRTHVKGRLLSSGLKENRCDECGITEWRGERLAMELHHLNGDGADNRLLNLRLLCPNCHSQTPNYGGRGMRRATAA